MALNYAGITVELREVLLRDKPRSMLLASAKGTVPVLVFPDGRADGTVNSATWGGRISYSGYLVPMGVSRVYKGSSL